MVLTKYSSDNSTIRALRRGKLTRSLSYMGTGWWRACIKLKPYSVIGGCHRVTNIR
jgi:hypothetical protein